MDKEQVIADLQPFLAQSIRQGRPLELMGLEKQFPGFYDPGYVVQLVAPWSAALSYKQTMDIVVDLLWETTTEAKRQGVSSLDVRPRREDFEPSYAGQEQA